MKNKLKHDRITDCLASRLFKSGKYTEVRKNIEYCVGEVDCLARRVVNGQEYLLLFEVKCNDRQSSRNKAVSQLERAEYNLGRDSDRVFKFYVHGSKQGYEVLRYWGGVL